MTARLRPVLLAVCVCISAALGAAGVRADAPVPTFVPIALAPVQRDSPIELVALTLDAEIGESSGHTQISGNSTFKLHNTDKLNDLQVPIGFPAWAGDPYAFDPARLDVFSVSVDGKKVASLAPGRADLRIGNAVRAVDWYTFTLSIAGDEKRTVRYDFQQDLGESSLSRFTYGLAPALAWKGSIGSARLTVRFPDSTALEQIVAYDPPNPHFDGASLTWRFASNEPVVNPSFTLVRPSVWEDLLAKRRAVQQNPNDANGRAALGNLFGLLALTDSPRRDGYFGQAVAELETATRLDPNNRAARQALAALYESRAGPASGPRATAYVSLAIAQWQLLASNDANARRQLAEDYFYLGLDAQTRGAFGEAAVYFDKASALAPRGAGPLFTPEHAAAQRRALNIAWARALLEQNDASAAMTKARAALGDAFMASVKPPQFYAMRAQVAMSSQSRAMMFTLAPLQALGELENDLSGVVASLRAAGADADLAVENSNAVLTMQVSFNSSGELRDQLGALAQALPERADWSLVRTVLSPDDLEWEEIDALFTHVARYREGVDLSSACGAFSAQLDLISSRLTPLDTASSTDEEAQLKRALLKYALGGWQSARSSGRVVYRAAANETRVDACGAQTIAWSPSTWRPERVALIVAAIELLGIGILVARWKSRKQNEANKRAV